MKKIGTVVVLATLVLIAASAASRSDPSQDGTSSATVEQLEKRLNEMQTMLDSHEKRSRKARRDLASPNWPCWRIGRRGQGAHRRQHL